MMDFMRTANAEQVTVGGFKRLETIMNKPVVKNKIDKAVDCNA